MINNRPIKVAIADKHEIFRTGTRITLEANEQFKVIWEVEEPRNLLQKLKADMPDALLIDVTSGETATINTITAIRKLYTDLRIVILSTENDPEVIATIMQLGVNACISKDTDPQEIHKAIITCINEEYYFNDLVNNAVLSRVSGNRKSRQPVKFTEREVSILKLIADDKNTEEISKQVFLSPRTIEAIRQAMKFKIGAKTTAGLVIYGLRNSYIQ